MLRGLRLQESSTLRDDRTHNLALAHWTQVQSRLAVYMTCTAAQCFLVADLCSLPCKRHQVSSALQSWCMGRAMEHFGGGGCMSVLHCAGSAPHWNVGVLGCSFPSRSAWVALV